MKFRNFILFAATIIGFGGCYISEPSYEVFKNNRNIFLIPTNHIMVLNFHKRREIYDENRYIYKFKGDDPRCIHGYLTNKDDKSERVLDWVILSRKEYCKERRAWALSF